jgi:hypothetical protein
MTLRARSVEKKSNTVQVNPDEYKKIKKYLNGFRSQKIARIFGKGAKSIPAYLIEAAYYLPYIVILGLNISVMYSWAMGGSLLALFTSSIIGFTALIAAVGVIFVNIILQYRRMSQLRYAGNNLTRLTGLAVLLAAVLFTIYAPGQA